MDLGGHSIADPHGDSEQWSQKPSEGKEPAEDNFKFTNNDRDKEMAFLLKKFYEGKLSCCIEGIILLTSETSADNPDPEMVVPSSALLDPWTDSYQQEMLKQEKLNRIQRRQGVWDASLEPEQNSGKKEQNSGKKEQSSGGKEQNSGKPTHSGSGRRRHRRLRRRQKRSPVHYGRGVHRSSHPEHYVTRYRIYQDCQELNIKKESQQRKANPTLQKFGSIKGCHSRVIMGTGKMATWYPRFVSTARAGNFNFKFKVPNYHLHMFLPIL